MLPMSCVFRIQWEHTSVFPTHAGDTMVCHTWRLQNSSPHCRWLCFAGFCATNILRRIVLLRFTRCSKLLDSRLVVTARLFLHLTKHCGYFPDCNILPGSCIISVIRCGTTTISGLVSCASLLVQCIIAFCPASLQMPTREPYWKFWLKIARTWQWVSLCQLMETQRS